VLIYVTVNIQNVLFWLECRHGDIYGTDNVDPSAEFFLIQMD